MTQKSDTPNFPLKPLSGYVVIKPLEVETHKQEKGAFTVADEGKTMEAAGIIEAVGSKVPHPTRDGLDIEPEVKIGDKVVFRRFGNESYKHKGQEYYHIKFTDLLSIIDD